MIERKECRQNKQNRLIKYVQIHLVFLATHQQLLDLEILQVIKKKIKISLLKASFNIVQKRRQSKMPLARNLMILLDTSLIQKTILAVFNHKLLTMKTMDLPVFHVEVKRKKRCQEKLHLDSLKWEDLEMQLMRLRNRRSKLTRLKEEGLRYPLLKQ